jgi:hypothetical protein
VLQPGLLPVSRERQDSNLRVDTTDDDKNYHLFTHVMRYKI